MERDRTLLCNTRSAGARGGRLAAGVAMIVGTFALSWGTGIAAASTAAETTPVPKPAHVVLSNERTFTTWAHPVEEAPIRARPEVRSHTLARTHLATEDGFPEVYLLLSSFTDSKGREWLQIRIPGRPNGRIGWITRESVGEYHVTHWLIEIALHSRRLKAYYNGKPRFTAPVGVGKPGTPTPTGRFYIREIFRLSSHSNPYWPYAIGTSDYSTLTDWPGGGVVGIHGDFGEPQLIPGDPSHGCVRMHAQDIGWLAPHVTLGTPVHIVI